MRCESTLDTLGESDAPISDHVQDGTKLARLTQCTRCLAVYGVQEARDGVGHGAELGVSRHVGQ